MCDSEETVITPLTCLSYRGPARLADQVAALAGERAVGGVVVGLPVTHAGTGRGERRVSEVVAALRARLSIPVELSDERGSTAAARAYLREAGVPVRRWDGVIDSLAAQLILETFLARGRRQRPDGR